MSKRFEPLPPGPYTYYHPWENATYTWLSNSAKDAIIAKPENPEELELKMATQAETDGYSVGHAFGVLFNKQLNMAEFEELRTLAEANARYAGFNDMRLGGAYIKAFCGGYIDALKGANKSTASLQLAAPIEDEDS